MNAENIPDELRDIPHWVVWRRQSRGDKSTKVPYQPRNPSCLASIKAPSHWAAFGTAVAAANTHPDIDGIGFVLTEGNPYVGIDIDDCLTDDKGIAPAALKLVNGFDTYSEISPSGRGIRMFLRGTFLHPLTGRGGGTANLEGCKKIEVYSRDRYLTVTGNMLPEAPREVRDCQEQLDKLCNALWPGGHKAMRSPTRAENDEDLLHRIRTSSRGAEFARLYDAGDTSLHDGDASRADLALCSMLAYSCGDDPDRIDRLFRRSLLYRVKWERDDYRTTTIRKAIDGLNGRLQTKGGTQPSADPRPRVAYRPEDSSSAKQIAEQILANTKPPRLFERASSICEIIPQRFVTERRPDGSEQSTPLDNSHALPPDSHVMSRPVIRPLRLASLQDALSQSMVFTKRDRQGMERPIGVPGDVARALHEQGHWSLPVLEGITELPILRGDGTIHTSQGYDEATGLYYLRTLDISVPERPSLPEAEKAGRYIMTELLGDFPFAKPCHRSAALALLLSLAARPNFRPGVDDQCIPLFMCTAPIRGSGKTYLFKAIYAGLFGQLPFISIVPHNKEEWSKTILTMALEGACAILWDNVESGTAFGSPCLDAVLTSGCISGRILGMSRTGTATTNAIHMVTGNNIRIRGDLSRRTIPICQDPGMARPELRTNYRHPDLIGWAINNRKTIATAALTILRAHALAGLPSHSLGVLGGFTKWDRLIRSAVIWCGFADPCGGMQEIHDHADEDTADRTELLEALQAAIPDRPFDSKHAFTIALAGKDQTPTGIGGQRPELPPAARLYSALMPDNGKRMSVGGVGKRLGAIKDSPAGGLVLRREIDGSNKALWMVEEWIEGDGRAG